jgi:hypothetical protein
MKVGYTFACFMTKKTVFSQFIQLPTYKSIFLFRISLYSKNKTCEELCYLSNDYFSKFFYHDLICQIDNCLTICFLNTK